ncbi:putative arabinogalactan protein [Cardiosporidium cionae]|uniref:Arabinogalactan protein n=1 Tax=Cardiosporidium cionae TaxID=476202 RepID=A0ABQ7JCT9_9APIC|nr:putative arabinogalactan protein [Cardiosporidium cionae]|eukprot:KAF8821837.1 putative arabinogalactan protein [Cardiosporidium cionae]
MNISERLFPYPLQGEIFLLKRKGIQFQATIGSRTYDGNGKLFLSTRRIVFVKKGSPGKHARFSSVEIPLFLASDVNFKQPIFGANYLIGSVKPLACENAFSGEARWSLTFKKGSCSTFLNVFLPLYEKISKNQSLRGIYSTGFDDTQNVSAFIDSEDPSKIYFVQPRLKSNTKGKKGSPRDQERTVQSPSAPPIPPLYRNPPEREDARDGYWPSNSHIPDQQGASSRSYPVAPFPHSNLQPPLYPPQAPPYTPSSSYSSNPCDTSYPPNPAYPRNPPDPFYHPNPCLAYPPTPYDPSYPPTPYDPSCPPTPQAPPYANCYQYPPEVPSRPYPPPAGYPYPPYVGAPRGLSYPPPAHNNYPPPAHNNYPPAHNNYEGSY